MHVCVNIHIYIYMGLCVYACACVGDLGSECCFSIIYDILPH